MYECECHQTWNPSLKQVISSLEGGGGDIAEEKEKAISKARSKMERKFIIPKIMGITGHNS
jgi:hypothetical protein